MNLNFILITPRVEAVADLHLGVCLHFPGDAQRLLNCSSLSAALVECVQEESALPPSEDTRKPLTKEETAMGTYGLWAAAAMAVLES